MQLSTQNLKFLHFLQLAKAKVLLKIGNLVQNTLLLYYNILYSFHFFQKRILGLGARMLQVIICFPLFNQWHIQQFINHQITLKILASHQITQKQLREKNISLLLTSPADFFFPSNFIRKSSGKIDPQKVSN